ncbi:uncharacterized protein LOC108631786 [Ceratina calcarata]|uniref:Uncharacterized protein LOC108631786 n=1 Tax=Ceratina calcarata TaxID=156304 RepID=A0AAJ7NEN5_9HYME|nr:uncharacterized protein LOC108631786 [Ceratina calcarata]
MDKEADISVSTDAAEEQKEVVYTTVAPVRVPPFWPQKVALWFKQLEAQFVISRITKDETKYGYVVGHLEGKYAEEVEDIICNPPETHKYDAIKSAVMKRLSDSGAMRIRKLLESEEIGDRTPTQFWRRLKELAGPSVTDEFLVELWKNRLPSKTQLVLAATSDTAGAKLAEIADRVHEIPVSKDTNIAAAASRSSEIECLREELKEMRLKLDEVLNQRSRSRSSSRDRPWKRFPKQRNNGKKKDGVKHDLCWYHYKFAERATRCTTPCKWDGPKPGNA